MRKKSIWRHGSKKIVKSVFSLAMAGVIAFSGGLADMGMQATTVEAATSNTVEYLNRGLSVFNTGNGMIVSWRYLASDPTNAEYRLYRDNTLIYTSTGTNATCYLDQSGTSNSNYRIDMISGSQTLTSDKPIVSSNGAYKEISLSVPGTGYMPNDCSVGDVDGDGTYEIFLKWDPSDSKDNSQSGTTGNVYIDCYKLDGTRLWRIDLGKNIRAGAHYTQFLVADFDNDGKAEMTCKTADGTVDGTGEVIGDSSKDYRNSKGYILSGPEYYTLFEGATGKALDTVNYNPGRGTVSSWGDSYGNRVDRFLGAVMYLDADHPSAVTVRGYYTRMTACAYDVVNKKLVQRWYFDSNNSGMTAAKGNGNHNCMPADVDGDGCQELLLGSTCIDNDGTLKWCAQMGHGDAIHVGDLLPDREGIEVFTCHEDKPYGISLLDGNTGSVIFHLDGSSDTGRCVAENIYAENSGAEFWGLGSSIYDAAGNSIATNRPSVNFVCYWDGDLERELLDGTTISKYSGTKSSAKTLLSASDCVSCNSTKATPCLSADLFGDWREEVVWSTSDGSALRIYATPYTTDYRITTLMQDPQYRNQVAGQNIAYNQPPHASFYLGSDEALPTRPSVTVLGGGRHNTTTSSESTTKSVVSICYEQVFADGWYYIKNVNAQKYMQVANNTGSDGANVEIGTGSGVDGQWWYLTNEGNGVFTLKNGTGYMLDIVNGKNENSANVQLYTANSATAQKFMIGTVDKDDQYAIVTVCSDKTKCLDVAGAKTADGTNVCQYTSKGSTNQLWIFEAINTTLGSDGANQNSGSESNTSGSTGNTSSGANQGNVQEETNNSSSATTVTLTLKDGVVDLSNYSNLKIQKMTITFTASGTGSGAAHLYTVDGGWLGAVDYAHTDSSVVEMDFSSFTGIGKVNLYQWWNSVGATISKVTITY